MIRSTVRLAVAAIVAAGFSGAAVAAEGQICRVTDPTGTPLNVRTGPAGEIVGTIGNGRDVELLETRQDGRGRAWGLIRQPGAPSVIGWVFREFITCYR